MTPMWAGGFALLFVPSMFGFQAWTRHKLGVNPPVRPVALALESRRYERLYFVAGGGAGGRAGRAELVAAAAPRLDGISTGGRRCSLAWAALGMIPGKMAMVQMSWPLPAERTEEHLPLQDASRRYWIRLSGIFFEWFMVIVLLGVALLHGSFPAHPAAGVALAGAGRVFRGVGIRR